MNQMCGEISESWQTAVMPDMPGASEVVFDHPSVTSDHKRQPKGGTSTFLSSRRSNHRAEQVKHNSIHGRD
jgi:hypothetical protein